MQQMDEQIFKFVTKTLQIQNYAELHVHVDEPQELHYFYWLLKSDFQFII